MQIGFAMGLAGIAVEDYRDIAVEAERAGTYALCVGEAAHESFSMAAYFATLTSKPKIITAITTWVRPPMNAAVAATTVDEISNGRFELGLGTMPDKWNRDYYGIDPDRPVSRMREYVSAIRAGCEAHSGRKANFDGEFYQVKDYERFSVPLRNRVPIHLAATRPGMARLAGEIADGVIVNWFHTKEWLHQSLEPAIKEGSAKSGNICRRSAMVRVLIEPNSDKAREMLRPSFELYRKIPYFQEIARSAGFAMTQTSELPGELIDAMTIHGSLDQVVDQIYQRYGTWADWLELIPGGVTPEILRDSYESLFTLLPILNF